MTSLREQIFRKMPVPSDIMTTDLSRCLTTFDLALFVLGLMTGGSIYSMPGQVALICAGPSVFIAFAIAGIIAFLNIACFAEFGSKVPKINGVYIYSYIIYGEIVAFIIAWCTILHVMLNMVYGSRNFSGAIDVLLNFAIRNATKATFNKITGDFYPDFLAASIIAVIFLGAVIETKQSSKVNKLLTLINMTIFFIILITSFYMADINNWKRSGMFPSGISSITCSVAISYRAYLSLFAIFAYCEEVENPRKALQQSVPVLLVIVILINMLMGMSVTLMAPYELLDITAPHADAFKIIGMMPFAYVVSFATVIACVGSLLSAAIACSRFVYALASDGLLFPCFASVNSRTKTPIAATLSLGITVLILTLCLDIAALLELVVIDSLMFSVLIAAAVLIVRYSPVEHCPFPLVTLENTTCTPSSRLTDSESENVNLIASKQVGQDTENIGKLKPIFKTNAFLQFCARMSSPCSLPNMCIAVFCILISAVCSLQKLSEVFQFSTNWIFLVTASTLLVTALLPVIILAMFEDNKQLGQIQVNNGQTDIL